MLDAIKLFHESTILLLFANKIFSRNVHFLPRFCTPLRTLMVVSPVIGDHSFYKRSENSTPLVFILFRCIFNRVKKSTKN